MTNLTGVGLELERGHHEVGTGGQAEINYKFDTLLRAADSLMLFKYVIKNTAWAHGKPVPCMPKPLFGDNGSGMHCHQSLWKDGEPLFHAETGYAGLSDMARHYIGGPPPRLPSCTSPARRSTATTAWCPATRPRSTSCTRPVTARPAAASRSRGTTR